VLPPAPETLALLQDETLRLAQLVEDVLSLARADAASGRLHQTQVDLKELIESSLAAHTLAIEKKALTVRIKADPPSLVIHADADRLARVLRNLADNAIQYAPARSLVEIGMALDESNVRVDFINAAVDLPAEDLPFLFERFYRGEKSRSRHHGGAGIGLSIVKELVQAHGGSVHARLVDERVEIGFILPTVV
jgi:two-component system, OmpR family, sensor histidine kinase BaeS